MKKNSTKYFSGTLNKLLITLPNKAEPLIPSCVLQTYFRMKKENLNNPR